MLSMIGSSIGVPICIDRVTTTKEKLSYAKLLVEVTVEESERKEV